MTSIENEFLKFSVAKLDQCMARIETCVTNLSEQQIWTREADHENSIGNLLLHLRGNLRQWILTGVGGAPDTRDRDAEFAARRGENGVKLAAELQNTVAQVNALIAAQSAQRLVERIQVQGYDVSVLGAIYHVVEHFVGHTFQIIFMTKRFTGRDLGFYAHLDGAKPPELPIP